MATSSDQTEQEYSRQQLATRPRPGENIFTPFRGICRGRSAAPLLPNHHRRGTPKTGKRIVMGANPAYDQPASRQAISSTCWMRAAIISVTENGRAYIGRVRSTGPALRRCLRGRTEAGRLDRGRGGGMTSGRWVAIGIVGSRPNLRAGAMVLPEPPHYLRGTWAMSRCFVC